MALMRSRHAYDPASAPSPAPSHRGMCAAHHAAHKPQAPPTRRQTPIRGVAPPSSSRCVVTRAALRLRPPRLRRLRPRPPRRSDRSRLSAPKAPKQRRPPEILGAVFYSLKPNLIRNLLGESVSSLRQGQLVLGALDHARAPLSHPLSPHRLRRASPLSGRALPQSQEPP